MVFHWLIQRMVVKRVAAAHLWLYAFVWKSVLCLWGVTLSPKISVQTPDGKWHGERCVCGAVTGLFSKDLSPRGADVASSNNKYCLISCGEVLIGVGLKYTYPNIGLAARWRWGLPVCLDCVFCVRSCLTRTGFVFLLWNPLWCWRTLPSLVRHRFGFSLFMLAVGEVMVILGFQKCITGLLRRCFEVTFEGICLACPSRVKLVGDITLGSCLGLV